MIKEKDLFPEHYFIKCLPEFVDGDKIVHPGWKLFVDYLKKIEGGGEINGVNVGRYCLVGVNDNGVWATVEVGGIAPGFTELTIDQWEAISPKEFYQESEKLSRIDDDVNDTDVVNLPEKIKQAQYEYDHFYLTVHYRDQKKFSEKMKTDFPGWEIMKIVFLKNDEKNHEEHYRIFIKKLNK